jgi:hypothetical protein
MKGTYKVVHYFFVKLAISISFQLGNSCVYLHCLSVWSVVSHGIKSIRNCQHPGKKGNIGTLEAIGITSTIPTFVMMAYY